MDFYCKNMLEQWKKIRFDIIEHKNVKEEIRSSWQRSMNYNIDPFTKSNKKILTNSQLQLKKEESKELLNVAIPIINGMHNFIKGSGFVVALADHEGVLLHVLGDERSLTFTKRANFIEGSKWSEDAIGTNAVGLCLIKKKPVQVFGYEHFCICAYNSTCSAAPILDDKGEIVGLLDITGPYEKVHHHTLGMAVAAANAIQKQIEIRKSYLEKHRTNQYMNIIMESISDGIFATDNFGYITHINKNAALIFNSEPVNIVGENIAKLLNENKNNYYFIDLIRSNKKVNDETVTIQKNSKKNKYIINCTQLVDTNNNNNIGRVVFLKEYKSINKLVKKISGLNARVQFKDILGDEDSFKLAIRLAQAAAKSDSNVLLMGESGTGKEMFAQAIHNASLRSNQAFIAINCAAIPRELINSELFGYDEGAFTGARKGGNPGKFELADQGTVFLDEIGEMPVDLQAALLRVLEERYVMRLGGNEYIPVNVRVITATNKNLSEEVEKKIFRQDLYYRLNTIVIKIPSLRNRKGDIRKLVCYFLKKSNEHLGKEVQSVSEEVYDVFYRYDWPGNIRELQNVVERAVNVTENSVINLENLPSELFNYSSNYYMSSFKKFNNHVYNIEEQAIRDCLKKFEKKNRVAEELGISRSTLYRKIKKYSIY